MKDKKMKKLKNAIVIAVDLDGTLCEGQHYTIEQCLNAKPKYDIIEIVNKIDTEKFVVIYTARRPHLLEATVKWLEKYNIVN